MPWRRVHVAHRSCLCWRRQSGANESRPGSSIPILRAAILPANFSHTQIRSGLRAGIPYDDSSDKIHHACASFGITKAESEQFSAELDGRLTIIFKHHYRPAGALE